MKSYIWLLPLILWISGCVALPVNTDGRIDEVAWSTTDLDHGSEFGFQGDTERFAFTLILRETAGTPLKLTKITWRIEHDQVDLGGEETRTGSWSLPAHGTLWQPFVYRIYCPPSADCPAVGPTMQWAIAFEGQNAQGQPVHFTVQPTLPWTPSKTTASLASETQERPAVVASPIHINARRIYYPLDPPPRR